MAKLQISDQQREINARKEKGKLLFETLPPAKKSEFDRILQSVGLKRADMPDIFGHLTAMASTVKERADPGSFHEGNDHTVNVFKVPAGADTVKIGRMLAKIDSEMDISAMVDSAQFFPAPNSTYKQIKLHSVVSHFSLDCVRFLQLSQ